MGLALLFVNISCFFIGVIVSQGVYVTDSDHEYNYEVSSAASKAMIDTALSFNKEMNCLLNTYQNSKAQACKQKIEINYTPIATTNTLLSNQLQSDLLKLQDADSRVASNIAQCGGDSNCIYQSQLEGYYTIKIVESNSLTSIKSIKDDGLQQVQTFMDNCVK